jgi:hypothetical protein
VVVKEKTMKKLFFVAFSALVACSQSPNLPNQPAQWESVELSLPHSSSATVMGLVMPENPNHLLVEGDILVPRAKKSISSQAVSFDPAYSSRLWTDAKVYYTIDANLTQIGRNNFIEAAKRVEAVTPIRFFERSNQSNYIRVFDDTTESACYSSVGMVGGGQTMSLGCVKNSASESAIGTAVHEIGHALGLWHEQSRADRDEHVEIIFANISPENAYNFRKVGWNGLLFGAYDFTSVMHYRKNSFSINGQDTIIAKNGASIIRSNTLSPGDAAGLNQLYGTQLARVSNTIVFRTMVAGSPLTFETTFNNTGALPISVSSTRSTNAWLSNISLGANEIASGGSTSLNLTFLACSKAEVQSTTLRFETSSGQILEIPFLRLCFTSVQMPLVSVSQISSNTLQIIWSEWSGAKSFNLSATADSVALPLAQSQLTAKSAVTSARVQIVDATGLSGKNLCFQLNTLDSKLPSNTPPLPTSRCLIWK